MAKSHEQISMLASRLAKTATGYAAVIDNVLNVKTVADTEKAAALNAIYATRASLAMICQDPDCGCIQRLVAQHFPQVRIVTVKVEVSDA